MKATTAITEAQFQRRVTDLCDWLGLRWFHSGDSRRDSCAGYPDLTIVGPCGTLFAELKTQRGRVTPEQAAWLDALTDAGQRIRVWRPSDWDEVEATLKALAGRTVRT